MHKVVYIHISGVLSHSLFLAPRRRKEKKSSFACTGRNVDLSVFAADSQKLDMVDGRRLEEAIFNRTCKPGGIDPSTWEMGQSW